MKTDFLSKREFPLEEMMPIITEHLSRGKSVRISPKGISMLPMIRQGVDSVVLSPLPAKIRKYDIPLYKRDDGKYILHRIVAVGKCYSCIGDNQFIRENGVRRNQLIAIVTAFYRGEKEYSVNQLSYKLYCRFWHFSRPPRRIYRGIKRRIKAIFK